MKVGGVGPRAERGEEILLEVPAIVDDEGKRMFMRRYRCLMRTMMALRRRARRKDFASLEMNDVRTERLECSIGPRERA